MTGTRHRPPAAPACGHGAAATPSPEPARSQPRSDPAPPGLLPAGPRRRFRLHAAALLILLLVVSTALNDRQPANSDEGAVNAQVALLAEGNWWEASSWRMERPFAQLDPSGAYTPLENSEISGDDYLPYAKHPLYPLLLLPAWQLFGLAGAIAVSAVAVWVAALAAAAIARRLGAHLVLPTLWLVGLGTPLLFDSTVVMGHALGAALLGTAVVCLLQHLEHRSPGRVGLAALAILLLVLLRSEGMLAALALSAVLGLMSVRSWRPARFDPARSVPAVVMGLTALVGYGVDRLVSAALVGNDTIRVANPASGDGIVSGRISAAWITMLRPSSGSPGWGAVLVSTCLVLVVAAAVLLRTRPERSRFAVTLLVLAALCVVARQFEPMELVSGLAPTVPLLVAGLVFLQRRDARSPVVQLCLGTAAVAGVAILATTYAIGGAVEWGGRFFHLLLPLVVPIAVLGLDRARLALPGTAAGTGSGTDTRAGAGAGRPGWSQRTLAVTAGAVLVASLSLLVVRTVHDRREASAQVVGLGLGAAAAAAPATDGGAPVLISDPRPFGRSAWESLDGYRLLRVPPEGDVGELLDELSTTDVGVVTVMTSWGQKVPDSASERWEVVERRGPPGLRFLELHQR